MKYTKNLVQYAKENNYVPANLDVRNVKLWRGGVYWSYSANKSFRVMKSILPGTEYMIEWSDRKLATLRGINPLDIVELLPAIEGLYGLTAEQIINKDVSMTGASIELLCYLGVFDKDIAKKIKLNYFNCDMPINVRAYYKIKCKNCGSWNRVDLQRDQVLSPNHKKTTVNVNSK